MLDRLIVWSPKLLWRLDTSEDKIKRVVDNWLDRVIGGFVIEFSVNT